MPFNKGRTVSGLVAISAAVEKNAEAEKKVKASSLVVFCKMVIENPF
jgi:hypothetical protein